jgi:hypothetical protein
MAAVSNGVRGSVEKYSSNHLSIQKARNVWKTATMMKKPPYP